MLNFIYQLGSYNGAMQCTPFSALYKELKRLRRVYKLVPKSGELKRSSLGAGRFTRQAPSYSSLLAHTTRQRLCRVATQLKPLTSPVPQVNRCPRQLVRLGYIYYRTICSGLPSKIDCFALRVKQIRTVSRFFQCPFFRHILCQGLLVFQFQVPCLL